MKISKAELIEINERTHELERLIKRIDISEGEVEVSSLVDDKTLMSDLVWLAGEKLPRKNIERFTCDCALINIEKIKPYTDKYDLIVEFLTNPTDDTADYTAAHDATYNAFCDALALDDDNAAYAAYMAVDSYNDYTRDYLDNVSTVVAYTCYAAGNREEVNKLLKKLFDLC